MGDMGVGQQPVVVADPGHPAAAAGPAIDGDELADHVAVADRQFDAFAAVLLVLRVAADRRVPVDAVVAADAGGALDAAMRADAGAFADLDVGADDGEGADLDPAADPRRRIDLRAGVDGCVGLVSS
jgi:hypothetical protein